MLEVKLDGLQGMTAKMAAVSNGMLYKYGRSSLRKAAKVVLEAARANAARIDDPATAENISKNIVMRWGPKRFRYSHDLNFRIGVLGGARPAYTRKNRRTRYKESQSLEAIGEISGEGKGNPGGDTWYWRLVEFGTRSAKAQPFLRPALQNNREAVARVFAKELNKGLDRAIKQAGRSGK